MKIGHTCVAGLLSACASAAIGAPTADQTLYVTALTTKAYITSASLVPPLATVVMGPRFAGIPSPVAWADLCQSLLAYYQAQNAAITQVVMTVGGLPVTSCP
jgi:hypothetical protein